MPQVLPGYRPPFNSETGRKAGQQSAANLKKERENYRKLGLDKLLKPKRPRDLLLAVQKAIVRHANASVEPNLKDCGMAHARNAKMFHDMYQSLIGNNPSMRSNSTKNHGLRKSGAIAPIPSIQPISPKNTPSSLPPDASLATGLVDSTVKPVVTPLKSIESTKIESKSDDDCPF